MGQSIWLTSLFSRWTPFNEAQLPGFDVAQPSSYHEAQLPGFDVAQPSSHQDLSIERHRNACHSLHPLA